MSLKYAVPEILVHQVYGNSLAARDHIQIYSNFGWDEYPGLMCALPDFVESDSVRWSVSDLRPTSGFPFCAAHDLYHGGDFCPVCSDNFIYRGFGKPGWTAL